MATMARVGSKTRMSILHLPVVKSMRRGLIASLAGTFIMDLCMMAASWMLGLGATASFSAVGDTVARFFSAFSIQLTGGVPLGVAIPYLVGSLIGSIYGIITTIIPALRVLSLRKGLGCAILYVEIVSQPIVWMTPILLRMSLSDSLQWFCGSLVMHLVWGAVLGIFMHGRPHLDNDGFVS